MLIYLHDKMLAFLVWAILAVAAIAQPYFPFPETDLDRTSFLEQFPEPDLASNGWIVSQGTKGTDNYTGEWSLEKQTEYVAIVGQKSLVMKTEAAFYAISKKFNEPFVNEGRDLVFQFEVKFQHGISCGGAYFKLLSEGFDPETFSDATPFEIMFGPDICGSTSKVHFIINKKLSDGTLIIESKLRTAPMARSNSLTNLYTLIVRENHDVEVRINGQVAKAGNMVNTPNFMVPPLAEPEYIPDGSTKPADWDDKPMILDSEATKPEDWDETHGLLWIPDPDAQLPEGWLEDEEEYIRDPDAQKPAEWDEEEDGQWRAPIIRNPKCTYGCGEWEVPKIANPEYKGQWMAPAIKNPNYKGEWKQPTIKNPNVGAKVSNFVNPIGGLGIEVWSMQAGIAFNNIYLGNSVEEAELIGNGTFSAKEVLEHEIYMETKPKAKHEPKQPPKTFDDLLEEDDLSIANIFGYFKKFLGSQLSSVGQFWREFQEEPLDAISAHPFRFAIYCMTFVVAFTLVFGIINVTFFLFLSGQQDKKAQKENAQPPKEEELTEEEMIAKITGTTGAKAQKTEVSKRGRVDSLSSE